MALRWTVTAMRQWPMLLLLAAGPSFSMAAKKSAAEYYVTDLPGIPSSPEPVNMHAGHIEITPEHNGNLFFWHFENRHIADRQRTVIWLNGGPGCSSEDGALMEIGPYRLTDDKTLAYTDGAWNEYANLLFVDNPVGTGFSYVDTNSYVHELEEMASQFVLFLTEFFEIFPQYQMNDIYIAGESYAGQYIPHVARAILDRNKNNTDNPWNLSGLLIGNGWISAKDQYESYIPFALQKGILEKDSAVHQKANKELIECRVVMDKDPGKVDYRQCEDILSDMLLGLKKGNGDDACVNMYDVRLKDSYPSCGMSWPPDLEHVNPYLRNEAVLEALHINKEGNKGWTECNRNVGRAFSAKNSKPSIELLPGLLEEVPILLFSGAEDLICSHVGTETLIDNMEWNGGKGFEMGADKVAPRRNWTFEGADAGFWQEARNLTYVLFNDASHMAPFDFPERSRDMLDRFMGVQAGASAYDSYIDGHSNPVNSTPEAPDTKQSQKKVDDAKWEAYRRSGEVVLVIVIIAASGWGYFIWRERRKRATYQAISGNEPMGESRLDRFRRKRENGDLEASAFDESELDDLHVETPTADKYSLGDDSDDESGKPNNKPGSSSR